MLWYLKNYEKIPSKDIIQIFCLFHDSVETYSESSQISKMDLLLKIVTDFQPLTILTKNPS